MADKENKQAEQTGSANGSQNGSDQPKRKADDEVVGKVYDARLMRRLGRFVRPYWLQAGISSLAVSLKSLCDVAGPILVMVAVDRYLSPEASDRILPMPSLIGWPLKSPLAHALPPRRCRGHHPAGRNLPRSCWSLAYLLQFVQVYLMQWIGQKIMFDLRRDIFRHMQRMDVGFFDIHPVGRLVTRLTSDVDAINDMFTDGVLAIVNDAFMLAIMAAVMLAISWWLALAGLCGSAADSDRHAHLPRSRARELSPRAHRHRAHQQLYAGTHLGHERRPALQPRRSRLSRTLKPSTAST